MNVSIKQLRAFVTLAQCSSFAEACELLHLSQPALSVAIRNMEEAAGGSLFSRSTRSLALSPEGRQFLPVARRLLADWDRAFDDLGRSFALQQGRLRLAAMPSYAMNLLPGILARFRERHPGINIEVEDIVMETVIEAVLEGRVELGIAFEPEQLHGLDFQPLFRDRFVAIVPSGSSLADKTRLTWKQLAGQPFIAMNRGSWTRATTDAAMARAGASPGLLAEASQLATIGQLVAAGLGVSVVPALCRPQMTALGLACRPLSGPAIERRVGILSRRRHPLSRSAEAMVALLLEA